MTSLFTSMTARFVVAILLAVLFVNFGNALVFDRVLLGFLVVATIASFAINKDTFSVLTVVCWIHGVEELHWFVIDNLLTDLNSLWLKTYCYGLCLIACYLQRHEKFIRLVLGITFLAVGFEIWWIMHNMPGKQVFWYILVIGLTTLARYVLFWRPHFLHHKFPHIKDWTFSRLDADCDLFLKLMVMIEAVMIAEYLLRYSLQNSQIIYFYNSYSYFVQTINLYLVLSIILELKRNYLNRHMHA